MRLRPLLSCAPLALAWDRSAHTQDITKNIQYITNEKVKLTTDPKTMKRGKTDNGDMVLDTQELYNV
ncbi:jg14989 [Pararge aegeria aegeria]|uniref:Jg14989 protein n=1 Tax=Pararge aegeria aegeria TaxID=348720 RepID=A0A8S4QXW5_9NEOP|nr:jg14989 [Pararge aegeria aegeria]